MVAGSALAAVLGVVLSYGAFLMALLGLFFYLLFGLIIGAVTFRIATPGGDGKDHLCHSPYARWAVRWGTAIIVLAGWGTSLAWEIHDFPHTIARNVIKKTPHLPDGMSKEAYRAKIVADTRSYLDQHYPPGGAIGYVRWMATNGRLEEGTFDAVRGDMSLSQRRGTWLIRVVLSLLFMTFGVATQTMPLAVAPASSR